MIHIVLVGVSGMKVYTMLVFCVEVLQPNQPSGVMSSLVSLPKHTKQLTSTWKQKLTLLPFLNQRKGENDHRKYLMINLNKWMYNVVVQTAI